MIESRRLNPPQAGKTLRKSLPKMEQRLMKGQDLSPSGEFGAQDGDFWERREHAEQDPDFGDHRSGDRCPCGRCRTDARQVDGPFARSRGDCSRASKTCRTTGRTRCNKIVLFDGSERHRGELLDVRITRAGSFTLYGDPAIVGL